MMVLLILLALSAASVAYLALDHRQAEEAFCKMECIEHQARVPHNY